MTKRAHAKTEAVPTETTSAAETGTAANSPANRKGTKQAALIAMLRAETGATIEEIVTTTGWQSHTVRGALSGALKKKLGPAFTSEKVEGRGRVYHLPPV